MTNAELLAAFNAYVDKANASRPAGQAQCSIGFRHAGVAPLRAAAI